MDYYNMLRLDYIPAQYFPDSDDALAVIRFYTNETDKITVPYYKSESWGGTCDNDLPFTGNGFTASKNGTVIPEYWCYDNITDTKQYCNIMDGAELYKVTKYGDEVLLAIYDSKRPNPAHPDVEGCFVRLEDINR